jgi:hypothetical protein
MTELIMAFRNFENVPKDHFNIRRREHYEMHAITDERLQIYLTVLGLIIR